ncbi:MAG: DUF928 domain-containing protein [Cyanobacteria bacterium P01_F01_bin.53]
MQLLRQSHRLLTLLSVTLLSPLSFGVLEANANPGIVFQPPTDEQINDSRGGASRPTEVKCAEDEPYPYPLTALIPHSGLGLTTQPHPTLLVYVPPTKATQVHFTLRDAHHQGVYQAYLPISPGGGIRSLTLPTDSPELLVGNRYQWSLALLCQSPQTDMPVASGYIQRIELAEETSNETTALGNQPLVLQANAYGQAGVWHDMLAILARLQQAQPVVNREWSADWVGLLQAQSLGAIANAPFLNEAFPRETFPNGINSSETGSNKTGSNKPNSNKAVLSPPDS